MNLSGPYHIATFQTIRIARTRFRFMCISNI